MKWAIEVILTYVIEFPQSFQDHYLPSLKLLLFLTYVGLKIRFLERSEGHQC